MLTWCNITSISFNIYPLSVSITRKNSLRFRVLYSRHRDGKISKRYIRSNILCTLLIIICCSESAARLDFKHPSRQSSAIEHIAVNYITTDYCLMTKLILERDRESIFNFELYAFSIVYKCIAIHSYIYRAAKWITSANYFINSIVTSEFYTFTYILFPRYTLYLHFQRGA